MGYKSPDAITFNVGASSLNLNDSSTYYFGIVTGVTVQSGLTVGSIIAPFTGTIRNALITSFSATATGTAEAWEVSIYNVTATVETSLGTVSAATPVREWSSNTLNIPVTIGDRIVIKTVTPGWVTNPEGTRWAGFLVFEHG